MSQQQRITERSNPLTQDIDIASMDGMVRLLRTCDAQMFCGYETFPSCFDEPTIQALCKIAFRMKQCIEDWRSGAPVSNVFMSGCGTSGRIAYFCARNYNYCIRKLFDDNGNDGRNIDCFQYIIAGGVNALVSPQEAAEDKPEVGKNDLLSLISKNNTERGLFIGITCGFSAAYVAGQIMCLSEDKSLNIDSVLFGFNPVELARELPIEGWRDNMISFKNVVDTVQHNQAREDEFIVLNPIVGPEGITGSTRMKGGSTSKLLLDVAFSAAILSILNNNKDNRHPKDTSTHHLREFIIDTLQGFEMATRCTYDSTFTLNPDTIIPKLFEKPISYAIDMASQSLKHAASTRDNTTVPRNEKEIGHIYYVGCGNAGILGFIDASECVPTYGAHPMDVRGFLKNGWNEIFQTHSDLDSNVTMESKGESFSISFSYFREKVLEQINSNDSVYFLVIDKTLSDELLNEMIDLYHEVKNTKQASTCWLIVTEQSHSVTSQDHQCSEHASVLPKISELLNNSSRMCDHSLTKKKTHSIVVPLQTLSPVPYLYGYAELSLKLMLNAITTGSHVQKGMTFGNRMINLKVSNNKLYYRAINIVCNIMQVSEQVAEECVLRAIYNDTTPDSHLVSHHISKAMTVSKVVPVALLLAASKASGENKSVLENKIREN
ncbi:hypothetical protein FDP41_005931 [Naegleria fowleri]|uniref:SIS domain-containing protein n=1 Tax=Naegleria fowleri TaxID=5763 RepID=A0A6A5BM07_NAEFO|nr:uncharacterized protein FDP41_005931 [Naegleria fowleri]KAF0975178.1 hypothetical protein FDP41_005931 [Naegleria fowleri]CAG4717466.1 unnamed protein product [Naegleria fowleri]